MSSTNQLPSSLSCRRGSDGSWLGSNKGEAGERVRSGDRRNNEARCYKYGDPWLGIGVPVDLEAEDVFFTDLSFSRVGEGREEVGRRGRASRRDLVGRF